MPYSTLAPIVRGYELGLWVRQHLTRDKSREKNVRIIGETQSSAKMGISGWARRWIRMLKKLCKVGSCYFAEFNEKKKKTQRLFLCRRIIVHMYCTVLYIVCKVLFLRTSASLSEALVQYSQDELRIRLRNLNEIWGLFFYFVQNPTWSEVKMMIRTIKPWTKKHICWILCRLSGSLFVERQ